jgi:mannose-6-phosphate isomerase-like protein (cupin superfamily)
MSRQKKAARHRFYSAFDIRCSAFGVRRSVFFLYCFSMSFLHVSDLPFAGMSHQFVGQDQGAPISAYIVNARPGKGPPLHTHPYVEVAFVIEGTATITIGDEQREVRAGGIAVIPANTPHRFVNSGKTLLRQIDIHATPSFIQTDL